MNDSVIHIDKIKECLDDDNTSEDTNELKKEKFIFKNIIMLVILMFVMFKLSYGENDNDKYYSCFIFIIYYIMRTYAVKKKIKEHL
jgi:hypothetical protein